MQLNQLEKHQLEQHQLHQQGPHAYISHDGQFEVMFCHYFLFFYLFGKRSIFKTFLKEDCCAIFFFLFFEWETSNFG